MTISRKRTAGAAVAGTALVFGAVFTPVAAYAVEGGDPTNTDDSTFSTNAAAEISTPDSYETGVTEVLVGGTGFTPGEEVALELKLGDGEWTPVVGGVPAIADEDGIFSTSLEFSDGAPFEDGTYTVRATQGSIEVETSFVVGEIAEEEATVATEKSEYTPAETVDGVNYTGAGFDPEADFTVEILPPGAGEDGWAEVAPGDNPNVTDAEGNLSGAVVLYEGDVPQEFALGEYKIRVIQGELTVESSIFIVAEEDDQTPTPTETEAPVEQTLTVEKDTYTVEESINGVNYQATGFRPDAPYTLEVRIPGNDDWQVVPEVGDGEEAFVVDAEGNIDGTLNFYDQATGVEVEFPEGSYDIRVVQGEADDVLTAEASFVVGEASQPVPTDSTAPTETSDDDDNNDNGSGGDDELAQTGADDMLPVFLAGGLVLMAAGAGLYVVRRRMEA
ncbi:MAG: LPXTG cell wall anchor domain-containing protein [Gulosibacter sp.]|uniref:LPXTG cell wall anchor domain-containing protein n=1 Tax=Gulosibacter sp. TaxID=2817531 RepID=UPI003F924640